MGSSSWNSAGLIMRSSLVLLCCFSAAFLEFSIAAEFIHYWDVEYMFSSPDCVKNLMMGINGTSPGPTIRAREGDTIVVHVTNKLETEGVVIHWHGIRQIDTPWDDGTASISQCAIIPHQTYTYSFKADKAGTFFYHGHYGMQRSAGLYGSLIVDPPILSDGKIKKEPFEYDEELPMLLLSDWWHRDVHSQGARLSSTPMEWIGEPQSILMNGRGIYDCSRSPHLQTCDIACTNTIPVLSTVKPNKTYKLRIASTTSLASLDFAIANHEMKLVEADGYHIEQVTVKNIPIYSGDSYSVIFTTNQDPTKDYWISATVIGRDKTDTPPPAVMLLSYERHLSSSSFVSYSSPRPTLRKWNDHVDFEPLKTLAGKIRAHEATSKLHSVLPHDHRMVLVGAQKEVKGHKKWVINETPLTLPAFPLLGTLKPDSKDGNGIYMIKNNVVVDVILQNDLRSNGVSEIHPWHLHGHDFWVLGYGDGIYDEEMDGKKLNDPKIIINPPLRNTVAVYPGGWTAIRFVANNPGVWAFHCHIEPHLHMGMGVIFALGRINSRIRYLISHFTLLKNPNPFLPYSKTQPSYFTLL